MEVKQLLKYINNSIKLSFLSNIQFRGDLAFDVLSQLAELSYYLIVIEVIFSNFTDFFGFSKLEIIFMWAIANLNFNIVLDFLNNMPAIANDITEGDLDKALMKPMNTFFYYLFKDFYILRIIGLLMPIMILIYVIPQVNLDLSIINILKFIILEICMFVFAISNMFFVMTLSFWLGSTEIYQDLFYVIFDISHYPAKSFLGFTKYLFVYAFPIVLMGSIPAMALLGKVSGNEMLIFTLVTLAWALAAYFTWKLGLKSYSSGNSMGGIS